MPDYDSLKWRQLSYSERGKLACQSWALQGYGTPSAIFLFYALKVAFYIWIWSFFCSFSPSLGSLSEISDWWLEPLAFQKAILWSLMFEVLGLGCGSGPLTGRYNPPFGGFLYFLRPGTTKLALCPNLPLLGGNRRSWFDVLLYAGLLALLVIVLTAPTVETAQLWPILLVLAVLTLADKTLFLAARGEHYGVMILLFLLAASQLEWVAGCKGVAAALWFFAGVSKLNHHFPTVVGVMVSNSPVIPWAFVRKRMYRNYPNDLRPSQLAVFMAHFGTALELGVPLILLLAPSGPFLWLGIGLMLLLHTFITSNLPMGVPIEWNIMVVYGALVLFWGQPQVSVLDSGAVIGGLLLLVSVLVPVVGHLFPDRISFLPAMRYYAGNWAMSIWLFKGDSYRKLHQNLTMSSPWIEDQLAPFYDEQTIHAALGKVMSFRLMHLHGRTLGTLIPKAIEGELADYEWVDGELVAGLVLGWNFGDGHLHDERLLEIVQSSCDFEEGELRCVFVESQPLFQGYHAYRIWDAKSGKMECGRIAVSDLLKMQPWDEIAVD
ncbi:MAG TPA: hypothetical protein EYN06_05975 [Myxococcales bacterium]|nr:hypothetical protein [Myxococcales bacterium]HIN86011.1 hypothetical protein [Myxococcales bacterium]